MLKVVTCKEENWVAEGRGREETLYPVTVWILYEMDVLPIPITEKIKRTT